VKEQLDRLVDELKIGGRVRTPCIEAAFRKVERHRFLRGFSRWDPDTSQSVPVEFDPAEPSEDALRTIYSDEALGTRFCEGMPTSSSSQPSVMADMLEALGPKAGMRILEIGTGTGYNAALLAEIVGDEGVVITLDIDAGTSAAARQALEAAGYSRIQVVARDGAEGVIEAAPFDRIVVTVGCPDLSPRWHEQLAEGGRLVAPLEHAELHPLVSLTKRGEWLEGHFVAWSAFIPIGGSLKREQPPPVVDSRERERGRITDAPAWIGFGVGRPIPGWGVPRDVMDFFLFLALSDRRAVAMPSGDGSAPEAWDVGLSDASGSALAGPAGVWVRGHPGLLVDLTRHLESWESAGSPKLEDWNVALTAERAEEPEGALVVDRHHYREIATRTV